MLIGVAAALLACVGYGAASVLQAYGARGSTAAASGRSEVVPVTATGGPTLRSTIGAALTPAFIAGMALDVIGFVGSIVSARLIPLFLSQTIISANLVVTAVLGVAVLGVRLHGRDLVAIGTVVVSLCVLGLTAGHRGAGTSDPGVHWGLLSASVVILAGGVGLIRLLGARAAVAAGLIAGVLYGAMAVAVRVLDIDGAVVTQLNGPADSGLHRLTWDLTRGPVRQAVIGKPNVVGEDAGRRRALLVLRHGDTLSRPVLVETRR